MVFSGAGRMLFADAEVTEMNAVAPVLPHPNALPPPGYTCAVMPTGGGKSLCYQLPAAMLAEQTAVVISPLIALMQDLVVQLTQTGISAAFANSSMNESGRSSVMNEAPRGKSRLG